VHAGFQDEKITHVQNKLMYAWRAKLLDRDGPASLVRSIFGRTVPGYVPDEN